ncbi:tRNA (N(6)-L-threonylcarbamoyladenosine(37)-C(2))-methylthiotransferase MtaB [Herbinix luporum]|jgi:threonylcarbamoyladenosine tRNA methylthiotransferase MtaB|uniref:tRNA (N(6)-L-threonylcarbamoyladenosine(37)-C(2))- methylthiotransferase MtaB n=1 Tax=Herbinix luporum TaxID=1679721 RepID=UPI00176F7E5B|nr:tRNA (N(6)-L-threonylcarbamoyladenosine(37)-C(2))-methylthiotransferase MtaB [Herbinix luporum]HHT57979.1 tRNA (N(6)-L-threonylcarbamoyladenosine(37)-C(2))-methylthiotransferase MtaB [Herbinix luporum]
MKKTAAFLTLGCKVNTYETEAIRGMFEAAGYKIVDFKELADVYVVNTCTVTNIADRKSRQMLHQAKKRNPAAIIVAVGCYVQAAEEELLNDSSVDLVVGNNKKSEIVKLVESYISQQDTNYMVVDIDRENEYENLSVISTMEKTRAFIKIQDGCNRFCSYCIIPYVRGRVRSRDEEDILIEVRRLKELGYKEFVLTGIHLSSYGLDRLENSDDLYKQLPLARLIKLIGQIPGIERIRLGSLEPRIITETFVEEISKVKQFCPHFHLSLQSGSNTVLKRMNRKYTAEEYEEKVELLRKYFDNPAFTTDIIVGFPGETEEEFNETVEFVNRIGFSDIHVFKYSKRAGTKAAKMENQIPEDIKQRRSNELMTVVKKLSKNYKAMFLGKMDEVLIEEEVIIEKRKYQIGHNKRYLKIAIASEENLTNQIIKVEIQKELTKDILLSSILTEN